MITPIIAIAALFLGIAMVPWAARNPRGYACVDGFVLVTMSGLVAIHIFPEAVTDVGWTAAITAIVGVLFPWSVEWWSQLNKGLDVDAGRLSWRVIAIIAVGLGLHAIVDGGALAIGDEWSSLHVGVVLHRLPMGLFLAILAGTARYRLAWGLAIWIALATLVGFFVGAEALPALGSGIGAHFRAFVAGTLVHVVFSHAPEPAIEKNNNTQIWSAVGAVLGLAALSFQGTQSAMTIEGELVQEIGSAFMQIAQLAAPAILGALGASWLLARALQSTSGMTRLLGSTPLPMCACTVMPTYHQLNERGVGAFPALVFLGAAPVMGLDALLLTWPLMGWKVALIRAACGMVGALFVAAIVGVLLKRSATGQVSSHEHKHEHTALVTGAGVDVVIPWFFLGTLVAAIVSALGQCCGDATGAVGLTTAVVLLFGLPAHVAGVGLTPLVAVLLYQGLDLGPALALFTVGPMVSIALWRVLKQMHGPSIATTFACAVAGWALLMGVGWQNDWIALEASLSLPDTTRWLHVAALTLVCGLGLRSLCGLGVRGWLAQIRRREVDWLHHLGHDGAICQTGACQPDETQAHS